MWSRTVLTVRCELLAPPPAWCCGVDGCAMVREVGEMGMGGRAARSMKFGAKGEREDSTMSMNVWRA